MVFLVNPGPRQAPSATVRDLGIRQFITVLEAPWPAKDLYRFFQIQNCQSELGSHPNFFADSTFPPLEEKLA